MSTLSVTSPKSSARRRQFEDCLWENLLKLPYNDISISDLCQQVGVSRRAFYRHFHDKEECFCGILNRSFQRALLHVADAATHSTNSLDLSFAMVEAWQDQRTLMDILIKNNLLGLQISQLVRFIKEEERQVLDLLKTPELNVDDDILICYLGGQLSLAVQWHLRGYDTPPEEMAKKYHRLVWHPLFQKKTD